MSKRLAKSPHSISRATPIHSDCCRLPTTGALVTKRANHVPISFDNKQAQDSQRHMSCKKKEDCSTEVHGDGGLKPVKLAASSRPESCASLKNTPGTVPVRRSLLALVKTNQNVVRDQLSPQILALVPLILAHNG